MSERLAIIGFGEAGQSIASGLASEGVAVRAFDLRLAGPDGGDLKEKALSMQVEACDDIGTALADATIVFSLVVGSAAVAAGHLASAHLRPAQIYVDLNSVSPDTKRKVGDAVSSSGVDFVEAAVMARVPSHGHRVPLLLAGQKAEELSARLGEFGMKAEAVGNAIGQASLNKMLRSVMVKGIEALLLECLTAAHRHGIEERILDSVSETFPGLDWRGIATYYLGRTALHGARRVTEMTEAADTVAELGLDPIMADAIRRRIAWGHAHLGDVPWSKGEPESYSEILAALEHRRADDLRKAAHDTPRSP